MKKALFRFSISSPDPKQEEKKLDLLVPLSPAKDAEPELKVSLHTSFNPVNGNEQLFKLTTTMKFRIRIYSDYTVLNKDTYAEAFEVAMNKDMPNELTVSPINQKDTVTLKPIKILED
jgi:hypothetical protein